MGLVPRSPDLWAACQLSRLLIWVLPTCGLASHSLLSHELLRIVANSFTVLVFSTSSQHLTVLDTSYLFSMSLQNWMWTVPPWVTEL